MSFTDRRSHYATDLLAYCAGMGIQSNVQLRTDPTSSIFDKVMTQYCVALSLCGIAMWSSD